MSVSVAWSDIRCLYCTQVVSEEGKSVSVMKNKKKGSFLVQYFGENES